MTGALLSAATPTGVFTESPATGLNPEFISNLILPSGDSVND
jgi:hypothetical protein